MGFRIDDVADSEKLAAEFDIGADRLKGVEVMLGFQGKVSGDRRYSPVLVHTVNVTSTNKTDGKLGPFLSSLNNWKTSTKTIQC